MQRQIVRGASAGAGLIFHVFAQDSSSTTGAGKASIAYGSWTCYYIRNGEAISGAITPQDISAIGTYAAPTANTNIRIKAVDNTNMIGIYELQIHADWVNTTNSCQSLTIYLSATGVAVLPIQIQLTGLDPQLLQATPTNITGGTITTVTNLTNAPTAGDLTSTMKTSVTTAATAATPTAAAVTGLTASDVGAIKTKTDQLVFTVANKVDATATVGGTMDANVVQWKGATAPAMTGDAYARLGAPAGTSVSNDISVLSGTVGTVGSTIVGLIPATADIVDAVWEEATADHQTTGTAGKDLTSAASAGDPWSTAIPGSYGVGTAGKIMAGLTSPGTLTSGERTTLTDAILDRINGVELGVTVRDLFKILAAAHAGMSSGSVIGGPSTFTLKNIGGTKNRIVAACDGSGNRTHITLDLT
jgi:hypothetical protein